MPDYPRCSSGLEETAEHAFYYCEKVSPLWDHVAVARIVIWMVRKKGLYDDANCAHRDLILFFRHQLRVKIRRDRKRLDRITVYKRWVHAATLVVRIGRQCRSHPSLLFLRTELLCFDLLTRLKMPFKVMHRKEVTHSNGSYERKSRGRKLADEMG